MQGFKAFLNEKMITFSNGDRYGNIVILAGGAASGKGFAASNFLRKEDYKTFDVDELKSQLLKIAQLKNKYPEIRGLDLRKPDDVFKLHQFVKAKGFKPARRQNFLQAAGSSKYKPNIMFDMTLKSHGDLNKLLPMVIDYGYDPKNINIIWVLADYKIAIKRNKDRSRVVPEDILVQTHQGAKTTMTDLIKSGGGKWINSKSIDGEIHIILNNNEETTFIGDDGKETSDFKSARPSGDRVNQIYPQPKKESVLDEAGSAWTPKFGKTLTKSFTSLKIKDAGKSIDNSEQILTKMTHWVNKNAPK